jgi:hypothetical protein
MFSILILACNKDRLGLPADLCDRAPIFGTRSLSWITNS